MLGVVVFALLLVATLVGPLLYRTSGESIDYGAGLLAPVARSTRSAPTTSVATCSPARCSAAGCRWPSASWRW